MSWKSVVLPVDGQADERRAKHAFRTVWTRARYGAAPEAVQNDTS